LIACRGRLLGLLKNVIKKLNANDLNRLSAFDGVALEESEVAVEELVLA